MNKYILLLGVVLSCLVSVSLAQKDEGGNSPGFLDKLCEKCQYCKTDPDCNGCAKCNECKSRSQVCIKISSNYNM